MERKVEIRDTGVAVTEVLDLVGEGHTYEQILRIHLNLTMADIMAIAKFASDVISGYVTSDGLIKVNHNTEFRLSGNRAFNLTEMRKEHPKAFVKWTTNEDNQLMALFKKGEGISQIAKIHQRKPGAIRARLDKLGLLENRDSPRMTEDRHES